MTKKFTDIKAKSKHKSNPNFVWNPKSKKHFNLFIVTILGLFICLNILIFYTQVKVFVSSLLSISIQSFQSLNSAKDSVSYANFEQSLESFKQAEKNFNSLAADTWFLQGSVDFTNKLTNSGLLLTESGKILSEIAIKLEQFPEQFIQANQSKSDTNLTADINAEIPNLLQVEKNLTAIIENLESFNQSILPQKIKQKLQLANQSEMTLLAMRHGLIDSNTA
jgi:hypothetical protein